MQHQEWMEGEGQGRRWGEVGDPVLWGRGDQRYLLSPVHATAAKTQHWPYLTGWHPKFFHLLRISTLPIQAMGLIPSS